MTFDGLKSFINYNHIIRFDDIIYEYIYDVNVPFIDEKIVEKIINDIEVLTKPYSYKTEYVLK